ncbi:MAG: hypothetical protein R3279_03100 [Putridiphycobacter sp.]|nr:hypothetical protein [Putridiphycobacter sp.]
MANSTSDSLFELIENLSKSEKRFFTMHASRHIIGEENNALVLFDFISKMSVYDEEKIFKEFKGKAFLNKFSVTKYRLYQQILESLNIYHAKSSVSAELLNSLQSASILFSKSLYSQSNKIIQSVIKKADKYFLSQIKWQALQLQRQQHEKHFYTDLSKNEFATLKNLESEVVNQMAIRTELWHIKASLFKEIHAIGTIRSDEHVKSLHSVIAELSELDFNQFETENRYLYHQILAAFYFAVHDLVASYKHLVEIKTLYDNNQALFLKDKGKYLSVLTNLAYISIKTSELELSEKYFMELEHLEKDFSKSLDLKVRYFSSYKSLKLFKFIENGYSSYDEQELKSITDGLELYGDIINPVRKAYLYYQLGTFYLANNSLKLALSYLNMVLNDKQNLIKEDIYSFAQILQVIVHFELKNHNVLPYVLTNTKRFLKGKNRLYKFEMIFLKMIGKIRNEAISHLELEDILIEYLPEIEALKQDKFESIAFEYFDFGAWLESKIQRKSYLEAKKASA